MTDVRLSLLKGFTTQSRIRRNLDLVDLQTEIPKLIIQSFRQLRLLQKTFGRRVEDKMSQPIGPDVGRRDDSRGSHMQQLLDG